jgi:hypothetical protein
MAVLDRSGMRVRIHDPRAAHPLCWKTKGDISRKPPPQAKRQPEVLQVAWVPAEKNGLNIPILDVRPVSQTVVAASTDPNIAENSRMLG